MQRPHLHDTYLGLRTEEKQSVVATTRNRFPFADWVSSTPSSFAAAGRSTVANAHNAQENDLLSLSFNAGHSAAAGGATTGPTSAGMWSSSRATNPINYGPSEMGMVGLRDLFVVAPSFHHNSNHHDTSLISDPSNATALGVGVGVGVNVFHLLTAAPCLPQPNINMETDMFNNRNRSSGGMHLWQDQYMKKPQGLLEQHTNPGNFVQISGGGGGGGLAATAAMTSTTTTCQDCGNQAKKDCGHRRCRTCCKSRGFDCPTHVKSTWVPAARRKERQLTAFGAVGTAGSTGSSSGAKKPRLIISQTTTTSHTSTSNTPPRSFDTSSSHQDASFRGSLPSQVRAPATFKCVRVTAVEDGEDEYAYQAVVKIGGHVFKGFLYDQGTESREGYPNLAELHLGGGSGYGNGGARGTSSSPIIDPADVYAASAGGFLGGSTYANPIN